MKVGEMMAPRVAFGMALREFGDRYPRLVVLDADVCTSTQTHFFRDAYPDRFYQMGIAEQNMVGVAAGMAAMGIVPFVSTFAVFLAKRAADQVRVSVAYPRLNVKLNGAYAGIPTGRAGATHSSVEDIAVMRAMPHMTVLDPGDAQETAQATKAAIETDGPIYIRTVRCPVKVVFDESHRFEIGKSYRLREGDDLAIVSTGMMTPKALEAADRLKGMGIGARLIHMPTLKPLDREAVLQASRDLGRILTVENHSVIGGLGGAVAEVLTEEAPCFLRRLGLQDHFVKSGEDEAVFSRYGMNVENIVQAAQNMVSSRKRATA